MALTQESLLSFLLERGGKVKNSELVNNFRSEISSGDPAEKQHNRELFKRLVNSVAVVRHFDEVKFVVVKKRYQDFIKDTAHMDDTWPASTSTSPHRAEAAAVSYSDVEENNNNNNTACPLNMNCKCYGGDDKHLHAGGGKEIGPLSRSVSSEDTATVKVLNISGDHGSRARRSGAMFAVIAVKSPQRDSDGCHDTLAKCVTQPAALSIKTPKPNFPAEVQKSRPKGDAPPLGVPQLRPQNKTTRPADDTKETDPVPLEPLAHEWLVKCAAGLWGQVQALLLQDTRLAQRKDFMSGFTALHWAAKDGNCEIIHKLMRVSRKRGTYINVNSKSHGGYTPLHVAAMHGHGEVMALLVQRYGASVTERDNAGKKPFHYLGEDASTEVRALLGGLQQMKYRERAEEDDYREHNKGFNSISKLFQPHIGRKHKTRLAHDW